MMVRIMVGFPFGITLFQLLLLAGDRKLGGLRDIARGVRIIWGKGGLVRSVIPELATFYRRDFHPWQKDNRGLIQEWAEQEGEPAVS